MSQLRSILLQANLNADYSKQPLLDQSQQVNIEALHALAGAMLKRAEVIAHAVDVMSEGTHTHPMQAFLHASECMALHEDERMSDEDFYAALVIWGELNTRASRANTATDVSPGAVSQRAFDLFAERFMRGE